MKKQPKKSATKHPQSASDTVGSKAAALVITHPAKASISEDQIRMRAFQIFQESGSVPGHEREHWLQAERELLGRS